MHRVIIDNYCPRYDYNNYNNIVIIFYYLRAALIKNIIKII